MSTNETAAVETASEKSLRERAIEWRKGQRAHVAAKLRANSYRSCSNVDASEWREADQRTLAALDDELRILLRMPAACPSCTDGRIPDEENGGTDWCPDCSGTGLTNAGAAAYLDAWRAKVGEVGT